MGPLKIIFGILLIICSIAIILLVMFQESKGRGLAGAIGGDINSVEGQLRGIDAVMAKWTKIMAIAFFVLVIAVGVLSLYA